jgi:hypothetical protein
VSLQHWHPVAAQACEGRLRGASYRGVKAARSATMSCKPIRSHCGVGPLSTPIADAQRHPRTRLRRPGLGVSAFNLSAPIPAPGPQRTAATRPWRPGRPAADPAGSPTGMRRAWPRDSARFRNWPHGRCLCLGLYGLVRAFLRGSVAADPQARLTQLARRHQPAW